MTKRTYTLLAASIIAVGFTGCSNPMHSLLPSKTKRVVHKKPKFKVVPYKKPSPQRLEAFHNTMKEVALSTRDDSKYNKMTLDTPEKKKWFKDLMFKLWDRQITRDQFILQGLEAYPRHYYEFAFVANGFQKRS